MNKYLVTIGVEVHLEIISKSKMFSSSENEFKRVQNTTISPIDLALPGTLPLVNIEGVRQAIRLTHLLNGSIAKELIFDRKSYFYPDLPKAYQLTTSLKPIGSDGKIKLKNKVISIEKIQLEEDTAKQIHNDDYTLLDYNRSSNPLIEVVTKPDFTSSSEVIEYLEELKLIASYYKISNAKMEEGSLRADINISLRKDSVAILGNKVEIKNLNSLSSIAKAIEYEITRQSKLLDQNRVINSETRRYDEDKKETVFMRDKSNQVDYRHIIDTNLPPINITTEFINDSLEKLPKKLEDLKKQFLSLNFSNEHINTIINNTTLLEIFDYAIDNNLSDKINLIINDFFFLTKDKTLDINFLKVEIISLAKAIENKQIAPKHFKSVVSKLLANQSVDSILKEEDLSIIEDDNYLLELVKKVIDNNNSAVIEIKNGKDKALSFLMAQIMKESKGKANPKTANELLRKMIYDS